MHAADVAGDAVGPGLARVWQHRCLWPTVQSHWASAAWAGNWLPTTANPHHFSCMYHYRALCTMRTTAPVMLHGMHDTCILRP